VSIFKYLVLGLVTILVGIVIVTYVALESGGVLEVETWNAETNESRLTHIWFVEEAGETLLEAGNPENGWVKDLASNDKIILRGAGHDGEYSFKLDQSESGHREIRKRMRDKYGWRDAWIAMLFDVEKSRLVRVQPL